MKEQFKKSLTPISPWHSCLWWLYVKFWLQLYFYFLCIWYDRWATQGFDFLQAIEPVFISALPEDDFLVMLYQKFYNNAITFIFCFYSTQDHCMQTNKNGCFFVCFFSSPPTRVFRPWWMNALATWSGSRIALWAACILVSLSLPF